MFPLSALGTFLDSLEEGVLFLDTDRRVVAINESASQMIGQRREALLRQLCSSVFAGTQCARTCKRRGCCTLLPDDGPIRKVEDMTFRSRSGDPVYLRLWALPLPPNENHLHCAIILRDRSREVELEQAVKARLRLGGMIGHSPAMQALYKTILRMASSDATVLITGESGTGKELVARALHDNSRRSEGPYITVNCAALPENLLESELFGHAKGAFTGAASARAGRFEAAQGGTLLLDEIGELPPNLQAKLLRAVQEREVVRLGENNARPVDVRVIAATHRDLPAMVQRGEFREDLYYRLRVLPLHVPALRDRREDIVLLADKLLDTLAARYKRGSLQLAHEAVLALEACDWPGNVRQLSNALEYAVVNSDGDRILAQHLPPEIQPGGPVGPPPESGQVPEAARSVRYYRARDNEDEKALILRALERSGGNRAQAAHELGMSRTTLWKRLKAYGECADAPARAQPAAPRNNRRSSRKARTS